jgi:hypothetical protein
LRSGFLLHKTPGATTVNRAPAEIANGSTLIENDIDHSGRKSRVGWCGLVCAWRACVYACVRVWVCACVCARGEGWCLGGARTGGVRW